jgi:pimeloyl-ACP methyl ester carboxylesterase
MSGYQEYLAATRTCIVAFASGDKETIVPDLPNFEFGGSLRLLGCSHVLMRDATDSWYEDGIEGIGDRLAVAKYIDNLKNRYKRVVTTGVSLGAYGALLYGQLAPAHEIIAISPLTALGPRVVGEFEDKWKHRVDCPLDLDLKPYFPGGPTPKTRVFISDGDGCELDRYMAERIGVTDITLIPGHTHGALGRHMRDIGMFKELFA